MSTLIRQLNLSDIIFSGYGYTIGADIFALLPYIVKNAKGYTWLAFLIGGLISLFTGLSYARLNIDNPGNDAEYSWMIETFKVKEPKSKKDKFRNKFVVIFSGIVIWAVMILGITMNSVMVVSISNFIKSMGINVSKYILNLIIILIPTVVNFMNVKNMSIANIIITILTSITLFALPFLSLFKHPFINDLAPKALTPNSIQNIIKAIGITILPYNGYQSVVQMSEEVKDVNNIPKGMIISGGLAILVYTLLSLGLISILGVSNISNSKSPIADAFSIFFGKYSGNIVNLVGILTGFTTLLLSIYSRSRLLSKLSELKIAPSLFSNYGINNSNILKGIPVYSVIVIGILSYICTILKEDSLEILTDITNILTFFVFICVNMCVLYGYYKMEDKNKEKSNTPPSFVNKLKNTVPIYALFGLIVLVILFYSSLKDFLKFE